MTSELIIVPLGTPAFPIYSVYRDFTDADGYLLEHLSEQLANFPKQKQAEEFIAKELAK